MTLSPLASRLAALALAALCLTAAPAVARVGNIATMEGTVEIGRGGGWRPAALGADIEQGDVIRTGRPGRVRIVFQDNSVLKVGDGSELVISESVYDPGKTGSSVLNLVRGKARSIVSDYYKDPSARFEVRTATAVSGVRGTDFVVAYDDSEGVTSVVGITGLVTVAASQRPDRAPVVVRSRQTTSIGRDGFLTPVHRANDAVFRQVLEDVEFIGQGGPEGLIGGIANGTTVAPGDRLSGGAGVLAAGTSTVRAFAEDGIFPPDASSLVDQPPASVGLGEVSIPF
ncbi:MAG TPA: FecR family protein [Terriglobales bacterium]|nr:FecR family protein [Terriglobales bacterium]